MRTLAVVVVAGSLGLAILLSGCGQAAPAATRSTAGSAAEAGSPAPATVQVASAKRATLSSALSYVGNVQARRQVSLVPKVAGRVTKLAVDVGSLVKSGDALLELDKDALAVQVAQAEAGLAAAQARHDGIVAGARSELVAQAEAGLAAAQARLDSIAAGPRSELVAQAEANLRAAEARLDQLKTGPTPEQRRSAMQAVEGAKAQLNSVNVKKDGDCNPYYPEYLCKASQAAAVAAAHNVDAAQAQYDALVAPPTEQQLAQAQAAVDVAREQLSIAMQPATQFDLRAAQSAVAQARAAADLAKQPATEFDLRAAKSAIAQAQAAVDLAKLQLAETTVRAPFAGVISQRMVSEGTMVGPSSPVLALISTDTEVVVNVDERALALIKTGQTATVTANAYPGEGLPAKVVSVAPTLDARSRTAQVRLAPEDSEGKLRDGMFAEVRMAASVGRQDALVVPKGAVAQEERETVVYVVADGRVKRQVVTTGASDGSQIEIVEGLSEGQQVAVAGLSSLRDGAAVIVQ